MPQIRKDYKLLIQSFLALDNFIYNTELIVTENSFWAL